MVKTGALRGLIAHRSQSMISEVESRFPLLIPVRHSIPAAFHPGSPGLGASSYLLKELLTRRLDNELSGRRARELCQEDDDARYVHE